MTEQATEVSVDDFAKVISCVGFITSYIGMSIPDGPQRDLAIGMGDDLIEMLLKYADDERREYLETIQAMLLTSGADTSVEN